MFEKFFKAKNIDDSILQTKDTTIFNLNEEIKGLTETINSLNEELKKAKEDLTAENINLKNLVHLCENRNKALETQNSIISEELYYFRSKFKDIQEAESHILNLKNQIDNLQISFEKNKKSYLNQYQILKENYINKISSLNERFQNKVEEFERQLLLEEYKSLRRFLSYEEYKSLNTEGRCKLASQRYYEDTSNNFKGLCYERFIGYEYEMQGYTVRYNGALNKYKDKGIDIIATKGRSNQIYVVQCKNWSNKSIVRLNTVHQLKGSADNVQIDYPNKKVTAILYAACPVEDDVKLFSQEVGIIVKENYTLKDYPHIKCHHGKNGEKIYHMPYDQQYDKLFIKTKNGDFYAWLPEEAFEQGFRHAHKWNPNKFYSTNE